MTNENRDEFFWLNRISAATLLVGLEKGQFTEALAAEAARGIVALEKDAQADPALRVKLYIDWEPLLLARTSPEVSAIHAGRSSQDILATLRTALYRDRTLSTLKALAALITRLTALAERHRSTVLPSYTNGVAAQPTTLGHTLMGFVSSLTRSLEALVESVERFDLCAMGAMVLNGTGWPLDRAAMAKRLGFSAPTANAFDATCFVPVDFPLAVTPILAQTGVRLGALLADVMTQYANSRPWILLSEGGENTYISSAMPQKRNPGLINNAREEASDLVSEANATLMRAHNVPSGMIDGKSVAKNARALDCARSLYARIERILAAIIVNEARAEEELMSDWTASQELADRLMRGAGVPFRIGHHFASRMVSEARRTGATPLTFAYERAQALYREEILSEYPEADPTFPMGEEAFRAALNPRSIVEARATAGSANPAEVSHLVDEANTTLRALAERIECTQTRVDTALKALEHDLLALAAKNEN